MPYSLVWLRHRAGRTCQLHCLGTVLENGFHPAGLVHKSELAKHRVTVAAAQQCAPQGGVSTHACKGNELAPRCLTGVAWGLSEGQLLTASSVHEGHTSHHRARHGPGRAFTGGLTGTCSRTGDGDPRLRERTGPSQDRVKRPRLLWAPDNVFTREVRHLGPGFRLILLEGPSQPCLVFVFSLGESRLAVATQILKAG